MLDKLRKLSRVDVQNRLSMCSDRELALSTMYMDLLKRSWFFSFLPEAKVKRVQEEIDLQKRLHIRYDYYLRAIQRVQEIVLRRAPSSDFKSYLRPRK